MTVDVEAIVVGAGVVGLAIARALALQGREVLVLERNDRTGAETSSRNSEVIHAGIYYPSGSLRARLCVEGKEALYEFCAENGVAAKKCGKLLVATDDSEAERLKGVEATANANGVSDLVWLTGDEAKQLEPELNCVAACLSPSTGVVDSHGLMQALEGHIGANGGQLVLQSQVIGAEKSPNGHFKLTVRNGDGSFFITAKYLVNAAGLGASLLGEMLGGVDGYQVPPTYPAKGHYFQLAGAAPFKHLIYPMPHGAWLGVHLTLDWTGKAKFGPDLMWCDEQATELDYSFEDADGARRKSFATEIRRYWPTLREEDLIPDYTGIRPKLYRRGEEQPDFAIHGAADHGIEGLVSLYGFESPGLTSSLAIGEEVARRLLKP